jgi:hypothetical protein
MANTFKFGGGNWAVKDGYALAYNDVNNNFKPLPFDFTRASSATRVNKQGLIETVPSGKPRIDFLDNTKGHLLLEPSRTNYITQSIDLADWASFVASGTVTRTNEYSTSPDGLNKATRLQMSGGSSTQWTYLNVSNSATYASFYVKSTGSSSQNFRWFWNNGSNGQDFTATTEWQRFEVAVSQSSTLPMGFTTHSDLSASDILVWGVQVENGSYATSYIPTEGSSVTRVAETANGAGNSTVFNGSEGVLYAEIAPLADDGTNRHIGISDNTNTNRLQIFFNTHTTTQIRTLNLVSNVKYFDMTSDVTLVNGYGKVAVKYKQNDFALWVNGVEVATDNSGLVWGNGVLDTLKFADGNDASPFYGKVKDLRVYNTALTDTELQNLTS